MTVAAAADAEPAAAALTDREQRLSAWDQEESSRATAWHVARPVTVASSLPHVDPAPAAGAVRAERPAADAVQAEAIPSPAPRTESPEPTVAPVGPSVEPAPPAHDQRDVPATGTSGRPMLRPLHSGQTT
jgi:hypothetical protein